MATESIPVAEAPLPIATAPAPEALAATVLALVEPGEEVVVIEPAYDSYGAAIALAGGVVRPVALSLPGLELDPAALEAAFSDDTAMVIVNTPHNPTGRTFSAEELALIGRLAERHDAVVLTDEVYEHLVFDDREHVPMATLPGMAERTQ